jgi:hypothetical protein
MKLVVKTITGNWFDAAEFVNRWDLANDVVSISPMIGNFTLVALKLRPEIEEYLRSVLAL